jgi:flagellar biosynthesis protein FliR
MAPASLIAAMLAASLTRAVIQLTEKAFKVMAVGVILALTGGLSIVLFLH